MINIKKLTYKLIVLITLTFFAFPTTDFSTAQEDEPNIFIYGRKTYSRLDNFDPASFGAVSDYYEWYQTNCGDESFYAFNQTHYLLTGEVSYYPQLATSFTITDNGRSIIVDLRDDVYYHDGTKFNADAVKWNYDRVMYVTENVNSIHYDWFHFPVDPTRPFYTEDWNLSWAPDGTNLRSLNSCEVLGEYQVKLTFNTPSPSVSSLADDSAFTKFSPTFYAAYAYDEILDTDNFVSLGPYKFIYHNSEYFEGRIEKFEDYYAPERVGDVDIAILKLFESRTTLLNSFLAGELDFVYEPIDIDAVNASSKGHLIGGFTTPYQYMTCFNTLFVNKTVREALCFSIDYNGAIESIADRRAIRSGGIVPRESPWYNESAGQAYRNLTRARKVLIDAGIAQGLSVNDPDEAWIAVAESDHPIAEQTYKHSTSSNDHANIIIACAKLVGIKIIDYIMEGGDIYAMIIDPDLRSTQLEMFSVDMLAGGARTITTERMDKMYLFYETGQPLAWHNFSDTEPVLGAELSTLVRKIIYAPADELEELYNRIQEIYYTNYLSIDWFHPKFYAGLSNDWDGWAGLDNKDLYFFKTAENSNVDALPECKTEYISEVQQGATEYINWTLTDDIGTGKYRIIKNNIAGEWFDWSNNTVIQHLIDSSSVVTLIYTIEYNDSIGQFGVPVSVVVNIMESPSKIPGYPLIGLFTVCSLGIIFLVLKTIQKSSKNKK